MNIYDDYAKKDIDIKNLRIRIKELEEENKKMKDIINKIVYLYKEEPTELEEYIKSWFKWWMSN